jgi:centromere protein X
MAVAVSEVEPWSGNNWSWIPRVKDASKLSNRQHHHSQSRGARLTHLRNTAAFRRPRPGGVSLEKTRCNLRPSSHTMPPNRTSTGKPRGRPPKSGAKPSASKSKSAPRKRNDDPFESDAPGQEESSDQGAPEHSIPPELMTRLLHEFFEKDGTRVTKDANEAVAKYVDIFVREAIARVATDSNSAFFEVGSLGRGQVSCQSGWY